MTLQNHVGDLEFPVRPRWRWIRVVTGTRHRVDPRAEGRRNVLAFLLTALPVGVGGVVLQATASPDAAADPSVTALVPSLLAAGAAGLLGLCASAVPRVGRPPRDQRRYLRWTSAGPVTAAQQSLLALDAPSDHEVRAWNSSLEHEPSWVRLPDPVRRRYDDGRRGQPLPSLPMTPPDLLRRRLDERYRIASADDVRLAVVDGLGDRGLSARFRRLLERPEAVARLSALTGEDEPSLLDRASGDGDRPAPLVWGADVQRAVLVVRLASCAGLLDEAEAWRLIGAAGDVAAAVHDGWAEYDRALLIGVAVATDSVQEVDRVRQAIREVRTGTWPAARAAFPRRSPSAVLPPAVLGRWQDA